MTLPDGSVSPELAEAAWLRDSGAPVWSGHPEVVVDLFSGCGGLSYGFAEAFRALGMTPRCIGVDTDPIAARTYEAALPNAVGLDVDISSIFDGKLGSRATRSEERFRKLAGRTTVLLGGPPCQGHSAFNNRTRHDDDRNALYGAMVRAAEVLQPQHVVIENVPGALRDRRGIVQRSIEALQALGYAVDACVVDMSGIGVPQRRKRLVVVASLSGDKSIEEMLATQRRASRGVRWAIEDLEDVVSNSVLDMSCASAPQTRKRIDALFERDLWDLPDELRPACHAGGGHSYKSIYGRLRWDEPAQTVTTGFYSMCMGRNVHPSRRRTITAHEAARLQYFPDSFDFSLVSKRTDLARLIGNAVPPKLGYSLGIGLLT